MIAPQDLVVEVRDVTLARRGVILPRDLILKATLRDLEPGEWTVELPSDHPMAAHLRTPGGGLIVSHRDRSVPTLLSGPAVPAEDNRDADTPGGTLTVSGVTDSALPFWRTAHPNPDRASDDQPAGWDVRDGAAETVMRAYVLANMGPDAHPTRAIPDLTAADDLGRGPTVRRSARFDYLGDLLASIATQADLGWRLVQVGRHLEFRVVDRRDRSGLVRLDLGTGTLSALSAAVTPPTLTDAIVAGQGEGGARTLVHRSTDAGQPWGPWGRREAWLDARNTDDPGELAGVGDAALLDAVGEVSVTAVPGATQTMQWPTAWDVGDTVGMIVGGAEARARVTEVLLAVDRDGARVGMTVGRPDGWTPNARLERTQAALEARLSALERNTPTGTVTP